MFSSNRLLALNIGASKVVLAEFATKRGGRPELLNYGTAKLGLGVEGGGQDDGRLATAIREVMRTCGIRRAPLLISLSGQMVISRFARLPAVAEDKLLQMIKYEVEQNVPFPLEDIVWNHQLMGDASSGEQGAMIVAAKTDSVREVTDRILEVGLEPEIIDVAPMALYNCLRYNYPNLTGCSVILDIGARSTNIVFVEGEKIYNRCIPVAGNVITQEIAKSFQISLEEAEQRKLEVAVVSMGGVSAYEDVNVERVSKIVRNALTRLYAEISRSINFYRSQQEGSEPVRLFLTGGSAVIPYLDTFFADKLNVEVICLNPFQEMATSARLDHDRLGDDAFILAESVGLALRRALECPVEVNLMPPEISKRRTFNRRVPYFGLAAVGLLLCVGMWTRFYGGQRKLYEEQHERVANQVTRLQAQQRQLTEATGNKEKIQKQASALRELLYSRGRWQSYMEALQASLLPGMWLTEIKPVKNDQEVMTGFRVVVRGWVDKLDAAEGGGAGTAGEKLRDNLRGQKAFGSGTTGIRITGQKDIGDYARELTLEINLAKPQSEDGKRT